MSKKHQHKYRISHTAWETLNSMGGTTLHSAVEWAYLICDCTSVIKVKVTPQ